MNYSKVLEWLDSPEGKASVAEFANEWNKKEEIREGRAKKVVALTDGEFNRVMERVVRDNGKEWQDKCYLERHVMPHPTNLLYLMIDTAEILGSDVSELWQEKTGVSFPVSAYELHGWVFWMMFGQGVHTRIYNPQEEAVIWL